MAEVLGVVASVTALIQTTGKVTTYCYSYIGAVKGAATEMAELRKELDSLKIVLGELNRQIQPAKSQPACAAPELETPLRDCLEEIGLLESKIKPRKRTKVLKFVNHCKWPLKASETSQAVSKIERYKSLFALALTADQLFLSKTIEVFSRETNLAVGDLVDLVEKEFAAQRFQRQEEAALRSSENRMKILNWLYPQAWDKKHTQIRGKRQEHTGKWLLREPKFQDWMDNLESQMIWGYGIPGAGKTYLSSLVIDYLERHATSTTDCGVAHIYFSYKDQDQQSPANVISSLIRQLGTRSPALAVGLPKEVEALYDKYSLPGTRPTLEELTEALLATEKLFARVFFVFDALDECHEDSQRKELLPLFHNLAGNGASIFVTSRPYPRDIDASLSPISKAVAKIELSAKEEDVTIYVGEKIKGHSHAKNLIRGKFRDEVVLILVDCCKGMFLLVHFYIEDLCQRTNENEVRTALKNLKSLLGTETALNETYSRAMSNIRGQHPSRARLALKVLTWLVKAKRTLTVVELRTAVSAEQGMCELSEADMPDVTMLLEVCAGLVIIDENSKTIQLAHYSVQEYLEGSSAIQEPAGLESEVVVSCINFLSLTIFTNPCEGHHSVESRAETFPFLSYAARYLDFHVPACDEGVSAGALLKFLRNTALVDSYAMARALFGPGYFSFANDLPKTSALHEACRWGHSATVDQLLRDGASVSLTDNLGATALHNATQEGQMRSAQLLLDQGADIEARDDSQQTPLYVAASRGHVEVVRLLLDQGADIEARDGNKQTPLSGAASGGCVEAVRLLIDQGADIEARDGEHTPLLNAVWGGKVEMARLLLDKGADIEARDGKKQAPLYVAVWIGHVEVARLLLDQGADIEARDGKKRAPLYVAASRGHVEVVRLLLDQGADIEVRSGKKRTPLYVAASRGHVEVVRLLIDQGADIEARDDSQQTPLYGAVLRGYVEMARLLLDKGADIEARDGKKRAPLYVAASRGHVEMARLLLDQGADIEARDCDEWTPLYDAASRGHVEMARLLLDKGADIETRDWFKQAPLHIAVWMGHVEMVRLLLDQGAGIEARDCNEWTPLYGAASRGHVEMARLLLDQGADIEARDGKKRAPLYVTVWMGHVEVARLLLDQGADIEARDDSQQTPLYGAASRGHVEVVRFLLDQGADIETRDGNKQTPLYGAASGGHVEVARFLLDQGADILGGETGQETPLYAGNNPEVIELLDAAVKARKAADGNSADLSS